MQLVQRRSIFFGLSGISAAALLAVGVRLLMRFQHRRTPRLATAPAATVAAVPFTSPATAETVLRGTGATATPEAEVTPAQVASIPAPARTPTVVGNRQSLVFHALDSQVLPAEENRAYFASEAEAIEAGYHRSKHNRDRERPTQ